MCVMQGIIMNKMETDILRWKIHSSFKGYKCRVSRAIDIIGDAENLAKFVLTWSGGKDSTAMVHLVLSAFPETPIMVQFDDCDWPEKRPYIYRVASKEKWKIHEVIPDFSVWDRMKSGRIGEEDFCSTSHKLTQDAFLKPLSDEQKSLGCDGVYMGLRSEESKNRKAHLNRRGTLYQLKSGEWRCCPIAGWTTDDVFAYHVENEIEINPCYFKNRFFKPEQIRLSWAIPTPTSIRFGDMEHFKHYYPEQFRRMRDIGVKA